MLKITVQNPRKSWNLAMIIIILQVFMLQPRKPLQVFVTLLQLFMRFEIMSIILNCQNRWVIIKSTSS